MNIAHVISHLLQELIFVILFFTDDMYCIMKSSHKTRRQRLALKSQGVSEVHNLTQVLVIQITANNYIVMLLKITLPLK